MIEERYHATTQNRFYPDMSYVNKNITVEAKLISPSTYIHIYTPILAFINTTGIVQNGDASPENLFSYMGP